ncbi:MULTISPECIES: nucleoside triphosphate pyrophosphohydrolase [Dehalobacter]|uniref:Nucleoside triphosphate pyrophosphohydrolase n=2 Tax=Dehalobacter restrictus TaxID=55583 RepID=A0A857DFU8_9FIRM|nr:MULTISPECIES: nucleoside triphosphate pyrophosphohydrolase [Dehalobacter]AHF08885.1 nucleotide pyrophosphohydrolase [Dehalobacter restrictus DSM 9455]MCG1025719.1 nucleoside triphosphate pyrophosphohydrolase [Dehalobacter sp.]MDJ0305467.1 nucleoside triphosphate pyrophosphohydrolase [Dehalobacter sp.]OCZ50058.1 nucleoside triphosphate pyrophosphohydrolase [Dehalobacter sp. TeCB1]QGZ99381.1 nucleoside triphosphate pyrophosphohydrolase [Dehalobacter restrictus]
MNPILNILGLGDQGLDSLSLAAYKLLKGSDLIFLWNAEHPAASDLIREGFPCQEIFAAAEKTENILLDLDTGLDLIAEKVMTVSGKKQITLALPGFPIAEGRITAGLYRRLGTSFTLKATMIRENSDPLERLTAIMAELRSARGCPWDKEQDHESLKKYLIEETYEVLDAIDSKNMNNLCEELGDLLLQVVFHSRIAEESGRFSLNDVIKGISDKLIRRHPHVFGSVEVASSQEVLVNWDEIKKMEKLTSQSPEKETERNFFDIPGGLPALQFAEKTQKKASKAGFDWEDHRGPLSKIYEELAELEKEVGKSPRIEEELGDLLFSIVNLSRFLGINAEEALRQGTKKFQQRFYKMVHKIDLEGPNRGGMSMENMNFFWEVVKSEEKTGV